MTPSDRPGPAAYAAPPAPPAAPPAPAAEVPLEAEGGFPPPPPFGAEGGFPPPPPSGDEPAAPAAGTNTMAVLALVFAFVVVVLGRTGSLDAIVALPHFR